MNIKAIIINEGKTLSEVAELLTEKYNEPVSVQNLSNKIRRKSLRVDDLEKIADVLDKKIVLIDKPKEPSTN